MSYIFLILLLGDVGNLITGLPHDRTDNVNDQDMTRIVGGESAPEGFAPHMVALKIGDKSSFLLCGGSIVSSRVVLTAAHCIESILDWEGNLAPSLRGIIGTNRYTSTENVITFSHHFNHPQYDPFDIKYDVGVLFTEKRITLDGKNTAPIPLKKGHVGGGEKCYVTGWGADENFRIPEDLQYLQVNTITDAECIEGVHQATLEWGMAPPVDPAVEICTYHSPGHGMCNGDSGSALVLKSNGLQVGIVSWGFPCARGAPDMFVRISGVWSFLEQYIHFQ